MRELMKEFVRICAEELPICGPVYEFGSFQVSWQASSSDLRPFFPGVEYIGADINMGKGVDVVLNLHKIGLPSETAGAVIIIDTLEHVEFPRKAIDEIYRILKPNGILIASSVMNFPIHNCPCDYWRFTPEAFKSLLRPFPASFIGSAGIVEFPHAVVGVGFKKVIPESDLSKFKRRFQYWASDWDSPAGRGWRKIVRLLTPPLFFNLYKKIRR